MKKIIALLCVLSLAAGLCSCSAQKQKPAVTEMAEHFDPDEYTVYTTIFYDDTGKAAQNFVGQKFTKEGTFTVIRDEYSQIDRYYVWGYADKTRCCDYQWEIVPRDASSLPKPGSHVYMTGTFEYDEAALDEYWFTDATLEVIDAYEPKDYDFDTTTMSPTLTRVEIINMLRWPEYFNGKTLLLYGRAQSDTVIQHPYYDGQYGWSLDFESENTPVPGTYILIGGEYVCNDTECCIKVSSYTEDV